MTTAYHQIAAALRAKQQTLQEPLRLPVEVDLANEHQVARNTVRRALEELERTGAVTRKRGQGTYLQPATVRPTDLRGMHIGLVPPWWTDTHGAWKVSEVMEAITRWVDDHGCRLSVIHADAAPKDIEGWTAGVRRRGLNGLIWAHPQRLQMALLEHTAQWLPTVLLGPPIPQRSYHCVMPDYGQAARLMDEHLMGLGHHEYSMLQIDHLSPHATIWIEAIEATQTARGQQLDKRYRLIDLKGFDRDAIPELLLNHYTPLRQDVHALVLPNSSYLQAFVAHDRFRERMSTDLSIIAFDYGKYPMDAYWPGKKVTHVTCSWHEVGRQAIGALSLLLEGKPAAKTIRIPVRLVPGDTTLLNPRSTAAAVSPS